MGARLYGQMAFEHVQFHLFLGGSLYCCFGNLLELPGFDRCVQWGKSGYELRV